MPPAESRSTTATRTATSTTATGAPSHSDRRFRLNENFNASFNLQINDIELSTGAFVSKLLTTRVNYSFNTKMFVNALLQYNSDSRQWSSNLRFNLIHRPLSDFFLVYNERRDDRTGDLVDRAVIAKMTYMMAF